MKNFFKRISVIIFSVYLCIAHPVFALADINDIIRNQYIAASVAVASLFSAFGFIPKAGNAALSDMVSRCVSDAQQAGYTVTRNGVPSVGIALSEGYTYLSKAFVSWVYSWSADNLSGVTGDTVISYPQPNTNLTYNFQPFVGSWSDYLEYGGFSYPANIVTLMTNAFSDLKGIDLSSCNYFVFENNTVGSDIDSATWVDSSGYYHLNMGAMYIAPNTPITRVFTNSANSYYYSEFNGSSSSFAGVGIKWKYNNDGQLIYEFLQPNVGRVFGTGFIRVSNTRYQQVWSTMNASIQSTTVGWDTTGDNPTKVHDIDEYAPNWVGSNGKEVSIDGSLTDGIPVSVPIDNVADNVAVTVPAADVISGTASAIDASLDMTQSVAREGAISTPAAEELEQENVATDNAISLEDAQPIATDFVEWGINYVKPHLSEIFQKYPFSIPYDMYLILNSVYSGSTVRTRSLNSVSLRSGPNDPTGMNPSNVGIILDFNYVERDPASYNDPNAPKFDYDFNVSAFGKNYHFVGTFDFAPYGWLFQLMKVGIGIIWIAGLLNYNIQSIRGKNK